MRSKRTTRIASLLSVIALTIIFLAPQCFAMNTGFSVETVDAVTAEDIMRRLDVVLLAVEPDIEKGFSCYDVNNAGNIALGFDLGERDVVLAYDSSGTFLYGLSLMDNGAFGLEWDEDHIIIFRVRSNIAIRFSNTGECTDIKQVSNTLDNRKYWNSEIFSNERLLGNDTYLAENNCLNIKLLHWGTYNRLSKVLSSGERVVIFDYPQDLTIVFVSILFAATTIITLLYIVIIRQKEQK